MISIDFETRSRVDLLTQGLYNYATDASTQVICMAYSVDGAEPQLWIPGQPVPAVFHVEHVMTAWNADFERLIWDYILAPDHGFPAVALKRWHCTAFQSRCNNLPGKLDNAARCLRVEHQKDRRGFDLIKLLSIPQADLSFNHDPVLLAEMYAYCLQDVRVEVAIKKQLREPTQEEWRDYHVNCRINDRGIRADIDLCLAAQEYAADEQADLTALIARITEGAVTKARGEGLKEWVLERLSEPQKKLLTKHRNGKTMLSLDKYNREQLLAVEDLDPDVAQVVQASDFAQRSSVSKFRALEWLADPEDERVRGALMCNGASQSGRYSSKGAQVHNFPRQVMEQLQEVRDDFMDNIVAQDITDYYKLPMMTILSRMLRPALIPADGHQFLVSDWSAIEGRVAPWLCTSSAGAAKLALYRANAPVYELAAAGIYRIPVEAVSPAQRQIGKVAELSLQYGGGDNAFLGMARGYGVVVTAGEAGTIKHAWRSGNPWAITAWRTCEEAAMRALQAPESFHTMGRLRYFAVANVLCGGMTLFCELPCGRLLTYPDARIEMKDTPWGDKAPGVTCLRAAFVPKAGVKEWPRTSLWGGLLFENAVQGTAASLLRHALAECDRQGLQVVLHVHDEIVVEAMPGGDEDETLRSIMNTAPAWAEGLPLSAVVKLMQEFGK